MDLHFNKSSDLPVYKQIAEQLDGLIESGKLRAGERLPTEREMGLQLNVARGTIKSVYAILKERGRVRIVQGSGVFVTDTRLHTEKEVEQAVEALLNKIGDCGLTLPQLEAIFHKSLWKRKSKDEKVRVAWVDCCAETLAIPQVQLIQMENMELVEFLLHDVIMDNVHLSSEFDVIVTTARHYEELIKSKPEFAQMVEKVMMTLSTSTIIELAKIPSNCRVVVWCATPIFADIIRSNLAEFENIAQVSDFTAESDLEKVQEHLALSNVLIVHRDYLSSGSIEMLAAIKRFEYAGGHLILFEYQLDKGSLIHFEEQINKCWVEKNKKKTEGIAE